MMNNKDSLDSKAPKIPHEVALHRYFIWANKMRTDFDVLLTKRKNKKVPESLTLIEDNMYMSYWYAGLYVVIEGWRELKLEDTAIDNLLSREDYVELLRRYRNGVFHYQKDYFDSRFAEVWFQKKDFVTWVRELNRQFGRYFLQWHARYNQQNPRTDKVN
jgi:hypothetical protein